MTMITTHYQTFELHGNETLLEGLERTGHEVAYQCRSGYCGACRVKLLEGTVEYTDLPLAFVADDEILPCCCQVTANIKLDCGGRLHANDLFLQPHCR